MRKMIIPANCYFCGKQATHMNNNGYPLCEDCLMEYGGNPEDIGGYPSCCKSCCYWDAEKTRCREPHCIQVD